MGVVLPATLTLFWVYTQLYTLIYSIWTTLCFPFYLLQDTVDESEGFILFLRGRV